MYAFTLSEIDSRRADYRARQNADDRNAKRIGNLGEIAFGRFCREYTPTEMWNITAKTDLLREIAEEASHFSGGRMSTTGPRDRAR